MISDAMIDALSAHGPDPALSEKLMLFGQFVGSWDLDVVNVAPDGKTTAMKGEWHFGWALEGRAVMDVWIAPKRPERAKQQKYEYGVSVRFYDDEIKAWRSTWIGPMRRLVRPFVARQVGAEIILEGAFEPGTLTRWMFYDIEKDSFQWRNMESPDDGKTWTVIQRMSAVRRKNNRPHS